MSSTTPNIGLTKTTAAETIGQNWAASNDSGGNFDIIDTKIGAVGNTSLQAQVDALSSQIGNLHSARVNWGTSMSSSGFHIGILLTGHEPPIVVWFAATDTINIRGLCEPQFTKSSSNSISFSPTSSSGTSHTITRNGNNISVTSTGNNSMALIFV